jgi:ABC-type transport system involved in cytochrome bd biosynthesis fused ATPase/permease subunit
MKMPSNLMQLRVLAFSLVLIIVPFIVFYYFWVNNQTRYFNGRNLRILSTLGTHLQERCREIRAGSG